jgi:hypothetical protein
MQFKCLFEFDLGILLTTRKTLLNNFSKGHGGRYNEKYILSLVVENPWRTLIIVIKYTDCWLIKFIIPHILVSQL